MKIGELARATGLSTSGVRFYEEKGLIPPGKRQVNGYRDYPESTVESLLLIQQAQNFGFSLDEILAAIPPDGIGALHCDDVRAKLKQKLVEVDQHLSMVTAAKRRLVDAIAMYEERKRMNDLAAAEVKHRR